MIEELGIMKPPGEDDDEDPHAALKGALVTFCSFMVCVCVCVCVCSVHPSVLFEMVTAVRLLRDVVGVQWFLATTPTLVAWIDRSAVVSRYCHSCSRFASLM